MVWVRPRKGRVCGPVAALAVLVCAAGVRGDPTIVQPDIVQWLTAAQQSRADVWLVGDSIAAPLDAGFTAAAASHFGLAGSGVGTDFATDNGHVSIGPSYPLNSNGRDNTVGAVPAGRQDYVLSFGEPTTVGATPNNFPFGYFVNPGGHFDPQAAVDWHFWTASPAAGGSMRAEQLVPSSQTVLQTSAPVTTQTPANGLQHSVIHFNGTSGNPGQTIQGTLIDTSNTSILYSRLTKPGATGATVTTWSYGGHGVLDLYNDKYLGGPTSAAGRGQFLSAITDGGSGKLLVVLEEGTNDASAALANRPSVNGILPGNSPAAFQDNMASLIDGIKGDWQTAGKNAADLSFLVLGMYEYGHITPEDEAVHRQFTQKMEDLAHARSDVSFVDLYSIAPSWDQAFAAGYMADDVHPTILGATVYSQAVFDQLVTPTPEPAAGMLLLAAAPLLLARRRGRARD